MDSADNVPWMKEDSDSEQYIGKAYQKMTHLWHVMCARTQVENTPELVQTLSQQTYCPQFDLQSKHQYVVQSSIDQLKGRNYFERPQLILGMVSEEDDRIASLEVKGRVTDEKLINAAMDFVHPLGSCLKTLKLISCGLSAEHVMELARALKREEHHIQYLYLDRNPSNQSQNFHKVINNCSLKLLSLKHCDINNTGAKNLSLKLNWKQKINQLKVLNLTGNNIGSEGAKSLAEALRWNRSLTRLVLTGNKIRDSGAAALAAVLIPFPITDQEIRSRNRRFYTRQKVIHYYLFNTKSIRKALKVLETDKGDDIEIYNSYLKKLYHFEVKGELIDIFGEELVGKMQHCPKLLKKTAAERDRELYDIFNSIEELLITEKMNKLYGIEKKKWKKENNNGKVVDSNFQNKEETVLEQSNKEFLQKENYIRDDVGVDNGEVESAQKDSGKKEAEVDAINGFEVVSNVDDARSEDEMCSLSFVSSEPNSETTWSSLAALPGKQCTNYDHQKLPKNFYRLYRGVKKIVKHLHMPDLGSRSGLYNEELRFVYNELVNRVEEIIPNDPHPIMNEVDESAELSFCYGNYCLKHLNLSFNKIGISGLKKLLKSLEFRQDFKPMKGQAIELLCMGNRIKEAHPLYGKLDSFLPS